MRVKTLVLPVAGLGKRLRPLTLRTPKNLLPVGGRPLIEYALEEAAETGIRDVAAVVSPRHRAQYARYFTSVGKRFPHLRLHLRLQEEPIGNGHAILQAADVVKSAPFAVRFCDDLIVAREPVLRSLIKFYEAYRAPIVLLERVPRRSVSRYGVVGVTRAGKRPTLPAGPLYRLRSIVEKPAAAKAPSNLIIVGGYVLTSAILRNLGKVADSLPAAGADALPLAIGIQVEFIVGGKVYGWEFSGKRLDCGTLEAIRKTEEFLAAQNRIG